MSFVLSIEEGLRSIESAFGIQRFRRSAFQLPGRFKLGVGTKEARIISPSLLVRTIVIIVESGPQILFQSLKAPMSMLFEMF